MCRIGIALCATVSACVYPELEIDAPTSSASAPAAAGSGGASATSAVNTSGSGGGGLLDGAIDWKNACAVAQPGATTGVQFAMPPYTIELWFWPTSTRLYHTLVEKGSHQVPGWRLETITATDMNHTLRYCATNDLMNLTCWGSSVELYSGTLYHLAVVVDVGASVRIYSMAAGETTHRRGMNGNLTETWTNSTAELKIAGDCAFENASGVMDELRFWNTVRTETELDDNAYKTIESCDAPGLVAYYKFDEGTGVTLDECKTGAQANIPTSYASPGDYEWVPSPF